MGLPEIIKKELIIVPMTSSDKEGVIKDLVARYAEYAGIDEKREAEIYDGIMAREALGSTAMGKGIAIPHCKIEGVKSPVVVIGISRLPIDFGGEEKSQIFFLVIASSENPTEHIQVLASIARVCSSDVFVRLLSAAKTPADVYQLFLD